MKLSFLVFNSGNLFYDQCVEVMLNGKEQKQCQCANKHLIICDECNKAELSLGLVLLARIGLESPEEKYLKVLS